MGNPPKMIVGPAAIDRSAAAAQIELLTESHTSADFAATLALIQQALAGNHNARTMPDRKEVIFFTDLQRVTWAAVTAGSHAPHGNQLPSPSGGGAPADLRPGHADDAIQTLAHQASLVVIDLGQPQAANLAVTGLAASDAFVTPGRGVSFEVTLHQFASAPRKQCNVEFLVDNVPLGEQTIDVPAGGDATVRFNHRLSAPGSHAICVRAPGDQLEIDNSRWLVVPVRKEVRVLCVAGREGAAKYVADALNPNPPGQSPIQRVVISEGDFADVALADFDCVFLCNVGRLTANEAERLARYAAAGGGVVFFLGDRIMPGDYNAFNADGSGRSKGELATGQRSGGSSAVGGLDPSHTGAPLPVRIGELVANSQFGLDPLDYRHAIVAPFRGRERAGLLTTPVHRYYRLELPQDRRQAEVAVATSTGDPLIVTSALGRGRVVVVATDGSLSSVDPQTGEPWTNWPTWPSFLPIVRELLSYATTGERSRWQQTVGTALAGRPASGTSGALASNHSQITRPDGRTAAVSIESTANGPEWSYGDTNISGIYSLCGLPQGEMQQFAVNLNTAESDLTKIDAKDMPSHFEVHSTWQQTNNARAADVLTRAGWNESLLWGVLALLFAESFMAWQFGRGAP
jgi:hypothetical protein